jgi:ribosome-binding factor A
MSRRLSRVEEACKEELAEILQREIKDPRVGFVTITGVKLTADLRHAKVFLSIFGTEQESQQSMDGLESAKGYLRSQLGKHLRLKYLPEIEYVHEHVAEEALRLEELMKQVNMESNENEIG